MFLQPHFLWLLLLPALLVVYQLRKPTHVTGSRKLLTTGLRLLALSLVILALAQPFQQIPQTSRRIVAVVDCSPSMGPDALKQAAAKLNTLAKQVGLGNLRLVVFGATAREVKLDDTVLSADGPGKLRFTEPGSAVAEALALAATLCPDNANGEVHLLSDGRETCGDMLSAAARLGRRGLELKIHELGAQASDSILLCQMRAPSAAAVGEAVTLAVDVECRSDGKTKLTVTNDKGETVTSKTVSLRAGSQQVLFEVRPEDSGLQSYHVSLDGDGRAVSAGLMVSRTVVGVFETAPQAPASKALRDIIGRNAEVKSLTLADLAGDGWDSFDALVLADTPAAELPVEIQRNLRNWVANGGGLLVTGGRNAFGPGGYARSELADMLPLRFPQKKEVRDPSTSLAVIIDTSGSMGTQGVNLAKEVARLALKRLKPHDKAGIVEFHGAKRWAAPMQPASNNIAIQRALNRLSAGGGTVMLPAVEEAYYGLLNVRTRTKHVLVLTDGGVEQGAFESLLRQMADDGIHVSTVLVGPRAGSTFLAQLASWGRGQFYTAPSRFKLPEVIIKQPSSSLLNPFVEKEVGLEPVLTSQLTQELDLKDAPKLHGYVKTEPKETTELLLRSEIGDPVLARWHYGLGRVAVMTTQLGGDWAEDFFNWQGAPNMMANLVRQLRGVSPRQPLAVTLDHDSAGIAVNIRALAADPSLAGSRLLIEVTNDKDELVARSEIMPVRAHTWRTLIEQLPVGDYLVKVKDIADEKLLACGGVVVSPPNEFNRIAPDKSKLTAATRAASAFAALAGLSPAPVRTRELWPICAAMGLILFILMILVRRLPFASAASKVSRTSATLLALLLVVGALGPTSLAMGQEMDEKPALTKAQQQHINSFLELAPAEGRQKLKEHCRELVQVYGDLQPLCDYLSSREADDKARQLLVVAAVSEGDLALARQTLDVLIAQPDPDIWVLSTMAQVLEMQGETKQAVETLGLALGKTKDSAIRFALLVRKAQLLYDENETAAARAAIRDILAESDFNQPEGRNYCARIAGLHGDYELVGQLFTPIGKGRQLMRDRVYFGQILMHLEKPAKAREQFDAAMKLAHLRRDRRYVLDRIVSAAREADQLPELLDQWLAADEMLPEQLETLVGVLGGELGRAQEVLALLERRDLPEKTQKLIQSPAFQERLILVALETGKSELAKRNYRDLIARYPKELYYHNAYARLLLMDGERAQTQAFFRKTIAETESVGGLMGLAASARSMALQEVAMEAATKAGEMGELAHVQAVLFEAELHHQHGQVDKTLEILQKLEQEVGDDAELIVSVSQAYERYGYKPDAIRLIRKAYDLTKSEKLLEKLIALMEIEQQHDQLYELWRKLWETATEPMAIIQARDRVLDLASKNGKLADIAIELEEQFDQGHLTDKELAMLLEIYTSVNDPVSAADILLEISKQRAGDPVETYRRMLQVYMECELFGRCNAVLRKLIKVDPTNRDEYLQTLALIALERKNDGDAMAVLGELASRTGDGALRDSFSASVLNMIGHHEQAARAYRRTLADNPDEVEVWLLWANALVARDDKERQAAYRRRERAPRSSEQEGAKKATGVFSVLMEEAGDNDLFTIAIDGLLNVRAPRHVLMDALRRVNERIALEPHKMFLYRLAADLLEEVRQPDRVRMILEQGLVIADDGRTIILRELIAMAKARNHQDEVILYGRSLLNTAEHLPPSECLELGTMLLGKGHFSEADNAFQRVIADGDVMGVTRDIILRYENAGLYGKAGKLLRELLIGKPFDVELLLRLGIIEEKKANFIAAGKAYQQALDLMIGRLPRLLRKNDSANNGTRRSYVRNLDETKQYFVLAAQGLIVSARTPQSRQQLLDTIQALVQTELKNLDADDAFGKTRDENPRLLQLTGLMRRLGFAFHRPGHFDPMDDDLLKRYPEDTGLLANLKDQRLEWGLVGNASQFHARNSKEKDDSLVITPYLDDPDELKAILTKRAVSSTDAEMIIPLLAMCGHDDLIDAVLAKTDLKRASQDNCVPLAVTGLATDRPAIVRQVLFRALAIAQRSPQNIHTMKIPTQIVAAWPVLSEDDRNQVVNQYGAIVDKVSKYRKQKLRTFHHYLMCQVGRSQEIDIKALNEYVKYNVSAGDSQPYAWAIAVRWLLDKPPADRPGALRQLVASHKSVYKATALLQLAMLLDDEDISDEFEEAFEDLLKSSALTPVATKLLHLVLSGYRENRLTKSVRQAMTGYSSDVLNMALVRHASKEVQDQILSKVKEQIAGIKPRVASNIRLLCSYYHTLLLQAATALSPQQLDSIIKDYSGSSEPIDMLMTFLFLKYAGREVEALAVLHKIETLSPEDPQAQTIRSAMPLFLNGFGWYAYSRRFLEDGAGNPGANIQMYFQLHDSLALLGGSAEDALAAGTRRMYAAMRMKYPEQFLQSTRIYWADSRHPSVLSERMTRYRLRTWPPRLTEAPGGLLSMSSKPFGTVLEDLGDLEGSQDELSYWLSSMPASGHQLQEPACLALAGNVRKKGLSKRLGESMVAAAKQSLLNRTDLQAITAIAAKAPEQLPQGLADQFGLIILFNRDSESSKTAALSRASKALGIKRFDQSLIRWSVARDIQAKGTSRWLSDYIKSIPEHTRRDVLRGLRPYLGINGVRLDAGGDDIVLFNLLLDLGMKAEAEDMMGRYLKRLRLKDNGLDTLESISSYYRAAGKKEENLGGGTLQDALAVVLARMNRPDDYRRILARQALLSNRGPSKQTMIISYAASPGSYGYRPIRGSMNLPKIEDCIHSLPEPDQVEDINQYINIHVDLNAWLKGVGKIGCEDHLAQICMLGAWCNKRGLDERATELLALADKLSDGMLTGRLWVADLHRLLGQEKQAAAIECELLGHDLLPMSRIPAALATVARTEGQGKADTSAYRVASYSNHPDILPLALRHARRQGLKAEAQDLAERLRKVSALFLPPGKRSLSAKPSVMAAAKDMTKPTQS